jgi:hypothetical protein
MRGRRSLLVQWVDELEDGSAVRGTLLLERLPAPPRVPDIVREYERAQVATAPAFRAQRITSTGSTLRLLPPASEAA